MITSEEIQAKAAELGIEYAPAPTEHIVAETALYVSRRYPNKTRVPIRAALRILAVCHGGNVINGTQAGLLNAWVSATEGPQI